MDLPTVKAQFDTLKKQRFLMHLIWQHKTISDVNSFNQVLAEGDLIQATCINYAFFNHSCIPNVLNDLVDNAQIVVTIRPVKKGEQLLVMYNDNFWSQHTEERQEYLERIYSFTCKCDRCVPNYRPIDSLVMEMDPLYQFIENAYKSGVKCLSLKKKCKEFLKKYSHLPCTSETILATAVFKNYLQEDYPEYRKSIL